MSYSFFMPGLSLMGENSLELAGDEIKRLGFKKALIVTDEVLMGIKLVDHATKLLDSINVEYAIFDGTQPNPTTKNVEDGLKIYNDNNCDFVLSFGGGSPHDCAKGIALVAANGGVIKDYEGLDKSSKPQVPLVAVNTTAGTASELTRFTIITDEERHIKMAIVDKHVTPIIAVNDPLLMHAMPSGLTAATGMDALTHAIEAYVSIGANPVTDANAEKAIVLIAQNLTNAVKNGKDAVARDNMAYAEFLAGVAFNNASLGYVHAMAHQLGGFYDLAHGVCNALLLPYVQEFNIQVSASKLKNVAKLMGGDVDNLSDEDGAKLAVSLIKDLAKEVGIPASLTELGAKEEDFDTLATNALNDVCGFTNPIQATKEQIIQIYKNAL